MTRQEIRNEILGGLVVVVGFPLMILGFFAIIPHI